MHIRSWLATSIIIGTLCGCGGTPAPPAPPPAKMTIPVVETPDIKSFAGEWSSPSQFLHLEADGTGYAANRSQLNLRAEVVLREDKPYWSIDFPDVEFGFGSDFDRPRATSKRLTVRLVGDTIELFENVADAPRFTLKKRVAPRADVTTADFAGDWKVLSVSYDPKDPIKLDALKDLLKIRMSLDKDGAGKGRYRTDPPRPDAKLAVKNDEKRFVLDGLHGKEWDMKLFFFGENGRLIQLREKGGQTKYAFVPPDANELPF